jgi:hypothetical protein
MCPESNSSSQPRVNWAGIPALRARRWDVGMATNCVVSCRNRRDVSGGRANLEAALPYSFNTAAFLWQTGERSRPLQSSCHVTIFTYFILGARSISVKKYKQISHTSAITQFQSLGRSSYATCSTSVASSQIQGRCLRSATTESCRMPSDPSVTPTLSSRPLYNINNWRKAAEKNNETRRSVKARNCLRCL